MPMTGDDLVCQQSLPPVRQLFLQVAFCTDHFLPNFYPAQAYSGILWRVIGTFFQKTFSAGQFTFALIVRLLAKAPLATRLYVYNSVVL